MQNFFKEWSVSSLSYVFFAVDTSKLMVLCCSKSECESYKNYFKYRIFQTKIMISKLLV